MSTNIPTDEPTNAGISYSDEYDETIRRMIGTARVLKQVCLLHMDNKSPFLFPLQQTQNINEEVRIQNDLLDTMRDGMGKIAHDLSVSTKKLKDFVKSNPASSVKITLVFSLTIIMLIWLIFFKLGY